MLQMNSLFNMSNHPTNVAGRICFIIHIFALIIVHSCRAEQFVQSSHKLTSSAPIHLDLKRFSPGLNSSAVAADPKLRKNLREGRTRPLFFQQSLGLKSGKPFNFDLNKWRQVRDSELFSDLSIVSFDTEDNTVALEIEGYERPSRHFSTGINIPANLATPELEVGVRTMYLSFSNSNVSNLYFNSV